MSKETKKNQGLSKEHFEVLLEDINDKFQFLAEGHIVLNNKIDSVANDLHSVHDELHSTRDELITLMKVSIGQSEERLTKKIEDGDKSLYAQLSKRIDNVENKIENGDRTVMEHVDQKIDEVKDILKIHSIRLDEHEERISRVEHKG